ncbi:hypothetical protein V1389_16515 [Flavobacterium rakeshii]|uniref:hypothetical protein n=1 Tax=Flavobacterium rakeshii TaxID=1038845 RepID=UPI002E7B6157|nr:hypothetical protein [Flavobacterium rakeshii]MEE1899953.1 hypothetical protein [Flavobacterium rakeshii]
MTTVIIIIVILMLLIPFSGGAFFIYYVYKKSTEKKSEVFLTGENNDMIAKVNHMKSNLVKWNVSDLNKVSNNLSLNFTKGFSRKVTGYINTLDNKALIAFQRIDRGLRADGKIIAGSTEFSVRIEYENSLKKVYFNNEFIGEINSQLSISNSTGKLIGALTRSGYASKDPYKVIFNGVVIAEIFPSHELSPVVRNPLYRLGKKSYGIPHYEVTGHGTVHEVLKLIDIPDEEQRKWLTVIVIFEIVFYGFSF